MILAAVAALMMIPAMGADFFDVSKPDRLFDFGLRLGVNTTNRTVDKQVFDEWNNNAWGIGVDAGAVVNLNIRDYLAIQPGFFFESRSGKYAYVCNYKDAAGADKMFSQFGSQCSYNFTIPVMAVVRFNVTSGVRWNVEAGPYVQIIMKNSISGDVAYPTATQVEGSSTQFGHAKATNFDFGMKFGSSLTILNHYTVGFDYLAGWLDAWKGDTLGGRNKGWVFYIGYDF